jgi:hypothetical protein
MSKTTSKAATAPKGATKEAKAAEAPANVPAVAEEKTTAVVVAGEIDFSADAGAGTEGADRESYAIPFLAVLQPMSPAVVDGVNEKAKPGKFINTVTGDVYDSPLVIPCAFQRRWLRWTPRELGGGFKGELMTPEVNKLREDGAVKDLDGRLYYPEADGSVNPKKCDRLADTRSHFVMIVDAADADIGTPAVFPLTSTGTKTSKNWLARIEATKKKRADGTSYTAPSFAQVYQLSTEKKTNDKGTWWVPIVTPVSEVKALQLYEMCKAFNAQINAGAVSVAHDSMDGVAGSEGSGEGF